MIINCGFCNTILHHMLCYHDRKEYDKCCENMEIVHNDTDVFINYGRVVGLGLSNENTNFQENR